ncbi:MAG: phosphatase PAP2 family protein [Bacteroidales bacterium]|mgnify:CR=1 FL=1|jgi:undecaprenyl-diphosphatase|nr:phosphatase PAP2 family protein [Bacteroidales bacterium]MDD4703049.1 phosphatase PAP2 family protein [Bacteroidales bacterium]MDX9797349.1 phosphatase PAP2 family protein [Bacteroidales bacterium]
MEAILNKDTELFYLINSLRTPFLDYFFGFLSHNLSFVLAILSAFLLLTIKKYRKDFWILIVLVALSFLLADRISVLCFKDVFQRLRPSHALEGVNLVKLSSWHLIYDYKGGLYGFVSSHAANAFSLATIFSVLGKKYKLFPVLIYSWAILVGYSRIYCGVHYPSDVIVGGILGIGIGLLIVILYKLVLKKYKSKKTDNLS